MKATLTVLFVYALFSLSIGAAAHGSQDAAERDDLLNAMTLLDALDEITVSVDQRDASVAEVLVALRAQSAVPLVLDRGALDRLAVNEDSIVTLRLERVTLSTALGAMLLQLGDEFERPVFEAFAGEIHLTTLEATSAMRFTQVYDVRDLVRNQAAGRELGGRRRHGTQRDTATPDRKGVGQADAPRKPGADAGKTHEQVGADGRQNDPESHTPPGVAVDAPAMAPPAPRTPGEDFIGLLVEHVDPDAWLGWGGSRARISERGGVIIVTAAASTHRALQRTLGQLRAAWPEVATIEAHLLEVPPSVREDIDRRRHATQAARAGAFRRASDVATLWNGTVIVRFGETAVIESSADAHGTERVPDDAETHDADAVADNDRAVRLEVTPELDTETSSLSLAIEFMDARAGDQRQLKTTLMVPLREGAAIVELPGASGQPPRVLILSIARR